jgi:hypothetical protein
MQKREQQVGWKEEGGGDRGLVRGTHTVLRGN